MTKDEALKLALEALDVVKLQYTQNRHVNEALTAIKEALAQPTSGYAKKIEELIQERDALRALAQPEERNFCQRCGKRTVDLTTIHTCTPPRENT
jgi:hypothetical protein